MENASSMKSITKENTLENLLSIYESGSLLMNKSKEAINEVLEEKFMTSSKFSMEIENIVKSSNGELNYIEAILTFCEENSIEFESVPKLLSKTLKEKLKYDAQRLAFMKKSSRAKLPI